MNNEKENKNVIKAEVVGDKPKNTWVKKLLVALCLVAIGAAATYGVMSKIPGTTIVNKSEKEVTVTDTGIADAVEKVYDAVVVVETYKGDSLYATGTGFIYKDDNNTYYVITNYHVISSGNKIKIVLTNGDELETTVVGGDQYADIAVLSFKSTKDLTVAEIGSSTDARVGDTVFTVGAPISSTTYSWTVTRGILSGKDRKVSVSTNNSGTADYEMNVLQTDAAINSGNSGGPLCNSNGQVIGITNMKLISSGIEGMGFAIPIEDAIEYADKLLSGSDTSKPYLGVAMADISQASYANYYYGITIPSDITEGAIVLSVEDSSAAAKAGLKKGDVITAIDGTKVSTVADLKYQLYQHSVGDKVTLTYIRDGAEKTATATLTKNS
jgi:serine protease Do